MYVLPNTNTSNIVNININNPIKLYHTIKTKYNDVFNSMINHKKNILVKYKVVISDNNKKYIVNITYNFDNNVIVDINGELYNGIFMMNNKKKYINKLQ